MHRSTKRTASSLARCSDWPGPPAELREGQLISAASERSPTSSFFRPVSADGAMLQQAAYLCYLKQRDGVPNLDARTLAHREAYFEGLDQDLVSSADPTLKTEFERAMKAVEFS